MEGKHAFLSASKYHWVNYDEEKLENAYSTFLASQRGTELHQLANDCIKLKVKLPKSKKTLNMYVNDCIRDRMQTEQPLYYSDNCFGTTDAISFNNGRLQIYDLKTGVTKSSMKQLEIYAAMFCLEYDIEPQLIDIELRIYQRDEVSVRIPPTESIIETMEKMINFDKFIENIKRRT